MVGKFGGEVNLADWRICEHTAKLNSTKIYPYVIWWVQSGSECQSTIDLRWSCKSVCILVVTTFSFT